MVCKRIVALLIAIVLTAPIHWASAQGVADGDPQVTTTGPRAQLATIVFAGLGGAILGLSTLSFYGRPQDKLSNIAVGFALGIIVGTIYTTYKTATNPYGGGGYDEVGILELEQEVSMLEESKKFDSLYELNGTSQLNLNYTWEF